MENKNDWKNKTWIMLCYISYGSLKRTFLPDRVEYPGGGGSADGREGIISTVGGTTGTGVIETGFGGLDDAVGGAGGTWEGAAMSARLGVLVGSSVRI